MDFLSLMQKCEFGDRFRRFLFFTALSLVLFHFFCLAAPLLGMFPAFAGHLRAISDTPRMFSMLTGCPPPELLVTVNIITGIRSAPVSSTTAMIAASA